MITPSVGFNLYVAAGIAGMRLEDVTKTVAPWMLVLITALLVIAYIPRVSLLLVRLLY